MWNRYFHMCNGRRITVFNVCFSSMYHVWIRDVTYIEIDDQLNINDSDYSELFDKVNDNIAGMI